MNRESQASVAWRRPTPRELALIFVFWTSLATVSSLNRLFDPRGFGVRVFSPAGPIALAFFEAWLWAAFTPLIFWCSSRFGMVRSQLAARIPLLFLIGVGISLAVSTIIESIHIELLEDLPVRRHAGFAPLIQIGRFRVLNEFLVYLAVLAAGFAREYFLRDQEIRRNAVELQAESARLQAQLAEARLDTLRMQINPHFLFNTLHAIAALVDRDPAGVRRMIARLSELLRRTIDSRGGDEVTLSNEMSFLRLYLDLMEIRFQGRLRVETAIDPRTTEALVPNLILQPIVENALEHGVGRITGPGKVRISSSVDGELLHLTIEDNGPGISTADDRPGGVGVRNTRARLDQLYGESGSLRLVPATADGGTIAEVRLPFHTTSDLKIEDVNSG